MTGILSDFSGRDARLWGHQPLKVTHGLGEQAMFSRAALARLIETYPREHYGLIAMGGAGDDRRWQEGDLGGASGETVLDAIEKGRLWLNLRNVSAMNAAHGLLLDTIFGELRQRLPGFDATKWQSGILISSPGAQVYYHADLPNQLLWQIAGKKRLWLYPACPPFITDRHLEDIALFDVEVDIPYEPWYDEHARVIDLAPGEMLSWPLSAPHRVENLQGLSVSLTVSFSSRESRRREILHLANGLLRHRFGIAPRSRRIEGAGYFAKAVLQKLMRDSGWVRAQRQKRREIAFRLNDAGQTIDRIAAE
jgi:hypothetical protein